jgi:hypothetical protein
VACAILTAVGTHTESDRERQRSLDDQGQTVSISGTLLDLEPDWNHGLAFHRDNESETARNRKADGCGEFSFFALILSDTQLHSRSDRGMGIM